MKARKTILRASARRGSWLRVMRKEEEEEGGREGGREDE